MPAFFIAEEDALRPAHQLVWNSYNPLSPPLQPQTVGFPTAAPIGKQKQSADYRATRRGWYWEGEQFRQELLAAAAERAKGHPDKLALAARLRRETTLSIKAIAARLHLGASKSANARLHRWMKQQPATRSKTNRPRELIERNHTMG
jgi:hypothetical protein